MGSPSENETWLMETGDAIIRKKARYKIDDWETLVYCLWVADYGMRNAGDLETAAAVSEALSSVYEQVYFEDHCRSDNDSGTVVL
jgi:hypothetical protein